MATLLRVWTGGKKSKKWYGQYRDHAGRLRRTPLSTNKAAAQKMLADLLARVERQKAGLEPVDAPRAAATVGDDLDAFRMHLQTKDSTVEHVVLLMTRLGRIVDHAGVRRSVDLTADAVRVAVADLARTLGTRNMYVRAARQFTRWLVDEDRLTADPLRRLSRENETGRHVRVRRALTAAELVAVVQAALDSRETRRGLTGRQRAVVYAVAAGTGLRAKELGTLTAASFRLDDRPAVLLPPEVSKNRRAVEQPLQPDVADMVRGYLAHAPAGPLWPGNWVREAAEMFRYDLAAAGVPYAVEGRQADFHALRHTYVTAVVNTGASVAEAMHLARHSDPSHTLKRYYHQDAARLADRVNAMPRLAPPVAPADRPTLD